jgi:hypothetical protein
MIWFSKHLLLGGIKRWGSVAYQGILFRGSSTNSVDDRGQRERESGGSGPLVKGSAQSANE